MSSEELFVKSSVTPRSLIESLSLSPFSKIQWLIGNRSWMSQEEPNLGLFCTNTGKSICQVSSETSTSMCGHSLLGKFTTKIKAAP